jgi:hypothetical protein
MNEDKYNEIEDQLEELPEEVMDFIFGGQLEAIIKELSGILQDEQQSLVMESNLTLFLFGTKPLAELKQYIDTLSIPDEKKNTIRSIIQEKIINELLLLVGEDEEVGAPTNPQIAPSPSQVLETLKSRLTEAKSTAPSTRDLSITPAQLKPVADPYREMPEK